MDCGFWILNPRFETLVSRSSHGYNLYFIVVHPTLCVNIVVGFSQRPAVFNYVFSEVYRYHSGHCILLSLCYMLRVGKALDIDWKAIEGMYVMGMKPSAIASTYGINMCSLKTRISRGKWKSKEVATRTQMESQLQVQRSQMMANLGTRYQERLTKHVEAGMSVLDSNLPTTRPEVSQHFDALGKVDKIATRAYGLESTTHHPQSTTLNLNLLRVDATPCTAETSTKKAEVIDVQ
jgi:hypothetical protein